MYKINTRKYPSFSDDYTHIVGENKFFYEYNKNIPTEKLNLNAMSVLASREVTVLDYGLGMDGLWSRITFKGFDEEQNSKTFLGYVRSSAITPIINKSIKEFFPFSIDNSLAANVNTRPVVWYKQEPKVVFEDAYNGTIAVSWIFENVTQFTQNNDSSELDFYLQQAYEEGMRLILENEGYDIENNLKDFYNFLYGYFSVGRAEEWFVEPRPCSPLKVLVAIPKRILYSNNIKIPKKLALSPKGLAGGVGGIGTSGKPIVEEVNYARVTFSSNDEYYKFTNILINKLRHYNIIISNTEWFFEPVKFYPTKEATDVKSFYSEVINLIIANLSSLNNDPFDKFKEVANNAFENLRKISWNGQITFLINSTDLSLTNVEYKLDDKEYLLSIGLLNFLRKQISQNPTVINYLLNKDKILKDEDISPEEFLEKLHFPAIKATQLPLDIGKCLTNVADFAKDLANSKTPEAIDFYNKLRAQHTQERTENEGDGFTIASLNLQNVIDPNIKILFGLEPVAGENAQERFSNYVRVVNSLDWAKYIAFTTACQVRFVDERTLQELLKNYKEARKVIEKILLHSLCNPYVTNGIKIINSINIPQLNTNNSLEALSRAISQAIIELLLEVIQTGLKEALNAILSACLTNPESDFGGASGDNLDENLGDALEDPDLASLLDEAIGDLRDENGLVDNNARDKAKQDLKNLANDLAACLSTSEFCRLLNGYSLNDEVYHLITALVERKYSKTLSKKFNSIEYIKYFFRALGGNMNIEEICKDNLENERPRDANLLCDTGKLQELRRQLLADKGMSPELIDEQLEDLRNKEKENLEKALKILNSDNPLDFSEAPDLLCKVFPNGETIAPPRDSLNKTVDAIYDPIFNLFNEEAAVWYESTYSISSSAPKMFELDKNTGEIKVKAIESNNNKTKIQDALSTDETKRNGAANPVHAAEASGGKHKLPSYIFKDTFKNSKYSLIYPANVSMQFTASLNGYQQMVLDANIIEEDLRKNTDKAEDALRKAVRSFLFLLNSKLMYEFLKGVGDFTASLSNIDSDAEILEKIAGFIAELVKSFERLVKIFSILDMYYVNNVAVINSDVEQERRKLFYLSFGINASQEAAAIFAAEKGVPLFYLICENFYNDNGTVKGDLERLIAYLADLNQSQYLINNQQVYNAVMANIKIAGTEYAKVKKYYKTVSSTKVIYPNYDIKYDTGIQKLEINNVTSSLINGQKITTGNKDEKIYAFDTYFNNKLYDLYNLEIKKNGNSHINIKEVLPVADTTKNYITDVLKVTNLSNLNKRSLYAKFLAYKNPQIDPRVIDETASYEIATKNIFSHISKKCIDSKFTKLKQIASVKSSEPNTFKTVIKYLDDGPDGEPSTRKLALVVRSTPKQDICGVKPHYLDLDSIKKTVKDELQNNNCAKKIIDEKIARRLPVTPDEIENLETTDFQKSSLKGVHQLTIRLYLHDIILRSIATFGYYDPQSLRDEKLYINFLSDLVEVEMRGLDNNYFKLLSNYLLEMYLKKNPLKKGEKLTEFKKNKFRRLALRSAVEGELKNQVLAKLSKRIDIDTNQQILIDNARFPDFQDSTLKLKNIYDDIRNFPKDFIIFENKSIKVNYRLQNQKQTLKITIFTDNNSTNDNQLWANFRAQPEFDLLFKYIFPVSQYLAVVSITAIMGASTRKQVVDAFRDTKKRLIKTAKSIQTNGRKLTPDPNNPQDLENSDPSDLIWKFIIKAIITTPYTVTKAFAEGSEPNLAIITTIFKLARAFVPELPSFLIPAASLPAIFWIPPINPILFGIYHGLLMWYDENNKDPSESSKKEFMKSLENNSSGTGGSPDCSDAINNDNYYVDKPGNVLTKSPISSPYKVYYGDFVESKTQQMPINVEQAQEISSAKNKRDPDGPDTNKDNLF